MVLSCAEALVSAAQRCGILQSETILYPDGQRGTSLLIGEILRRADLRLQRQARRRARVRKIKATFGIPQIKADEEFFLTCERTPYESN